MSVRTGFLKGTLGASVLEFAFTFPVFLLFIFGVIELGIVMWGKISLTYAANQAARYAYANQSTATNASIVSYARSEIPIGDGSLFSFTFSASLVPHTSAIVTGKFNYTFLYIPISPLSLSVSMTQPLP